MKDCTLFAVALRLFAFATFFVAMTIAMNVAIILATTTVAIVKSFGYPFGKQRHHAPQLWQRQSLPLLFQLTLLRYAIEKLCRRLRSAPGIQRPCYRHTVFIKLGQLSRWRNHYCRYQFRILHGVTP